MAVYLNEQNVLVLEFDPKNIEKHAHITYCQSTKKFTTEASTLNLGYIPEKLVVFNIQNRHTITFKKDGSDWDEEGNIQHWTYKSIIGAKFPVKLLVLND